MSLSKTIILPMFLLASVAVSGLVLPAYAAGGEAESGNGNSNKTLDLSNLVVPVEQDGKLINYLFVSVVVTVNDGQDQWKLRENAHVLRDLILKETHRETVGLEGEPMKLDEEKMKAAITKVFEKAVGHDSIKSIEIQASDSQKIFVDG